MWKEDDIVILRIEPDTEFITDVIEKVTEVFKYGVLAELLAKWYTRMPTVKSSELVENTVSNHSE